MKIFGFRKLSAADFPLLLSWLSRNHVKEWWNDGDDTLEKVAAHYGEKSDDTHRFILFEIVDSVEKPVGYFQYYHASDGAIGIDQFIGEEDYLNQGVGAQTIAQFINLIIKRHNPARIVLDPSPENKRAIRCYEKVGFKHYAKENSPETAVYMMSLDTREFQNK